MPFFALREDLPSYDNHGAWSNLQVRVPVQQNRTCLSGVRLYFCSCLPTSRTYLPYLSNPVSPRGDLSCELGPLVLSATNWSRKPRP